MTKFILFMNLDMVDRNSAPEEFACIWQSKRVGSDGDFTSNWKFPDCVHFFSAWARQAVIETIAVVYEHTKRTQEMCSPIGHNNTKHFLCPIRSRHPLEFLEIVRWESVPRDSSARTRKLLSPLFSRPDWPLLCLRGLLLSDFCY